MTPQDLIKRVRDHCESTGAAESTVSRKILGGGKEFERLVAGRNIGWSTLENAWKKLDELERQAEESRDLGKQKDAA